MPSRKVISVFIIALALVTSILLVSRPEKTDSQSKTNFQTNKEGGTLSPGAAIKTNTNWQDELAAQVAENPQLGQQIQSSSTDTLTDQLSRSLMANYFSIKQSGSLDSTSAANLVSQAANFVNQPVKTQYSLKDILVSSDNSKSSISKYGNDLGAAFKKNRPPGPVKNEVNIFKDMLQNKDQTESQDLRNIAAIYNNMAISLSNLTVPSSFIEAHITLTNNLAIMSNAVSDMSQALIDPARSLRGLASYEQGIMNMANSKKSIQNQILQSGVVYKQGENGYYFYFGI